jgi:GWxTD domain-containing protein
MFHSNLLVAALILICANTSYGFSAQIDTIAATDSTEIADPILLPANSTGDLDFALDAAGFMGQEGKTYTEFYLLLRPSQFTLEEIETKLYRGKFTIEAVIYDTTGAEVTRIEEERLYETDQPVLVSRRGHEERVSMDMVVAALDAGIYRAEVNIRDKNSKKEGSASKLFVADGYADGSLMVSDLQFSSFVLPDTVAGNRFSKGGLQVLPNPSRVFEKWAEQPSEGAYQPKIMYVYFEMYNLEPAAAVDMPGSYDLTYSITSHASGRTYPMPAQKQVDKPGGSGAKVLALDITSFPQDVYTMELSVTDNESGASVSRQSIFEVVQPPPPPPPVTVLSEKMAKRGGRMLKVMVDTGLANSRDQSLYKRLDLQAKTDFLINFWKERDPTPDTPENEFMIVFNERFSFADYQLGGAESDRGDVFMRFGYPEEIERHDSDNNSKSYQIWYYTSGVQGDSGRSDGGGRQYFVFGDRMAVGRYELLHSTAVGSVNNPGWRRLLLLDPNLLEGGVQGQTNTGSSSLKPGEP